MRCANKSLPMLWPWKRKDVATQTAFDKDAWESFTTTIKRQRCRGHEDTSNALAINYTYLHVFYKTMRYKYVFDDRKKNIIGISFWLPKCEANQELSCRMINQCATVDEAINFIQEMRKNEWAY